MDIFVSTHAHNRFRERFRLVFRPEVFEPSRRNYFIKNLFRESVSCDFSLKQKPGIYNALCTKAGTLLNYHMYKDKLIFVSTVRESKTVEIITVLRRETCE